MHPSNAIFTESPYIRRVSSIPLEQLSLIDHRLQKLLQQDSPGLRKTHYFHGRFENIYLEAKTGDEDMPVLRSLIEEGLANSAEILQLPRERLRVGFWFNLMLPGQVTTLHRHDDYDEVLSGVVYLVVPEHSGDLVLIDGKEEIHLPPVAGNYIFFSPATAHKVTTNNSSSRRLSIGMNFGIVDDAEPRH